jgi:alkylhydroperoxidase family enzyme
MSVLPAIDPATAHPDAAAVLAKAKVEFGGTVPQLTRVMANSPATLDGYLEFYRALSGGLLGPEISERIALLMAEENGCAYCLSAHSYVAEHVLHLPAVEITAAREGDSADLRIRTLLHLASAVNRGRGEVADHVVEAARAAGVSDSEIAEVVGHVAANVFSNYFAKASRVEVDFPPVAPRGSVA